MRVNLRAISEAASFDPAKALLAAVGDVSNIEMFHNLVLVATYIAPPKIMKGPNGEEIMFHRPDNSIAEDRYQGKAALVLQLGPLAFKDEGAIKFGGVSIKPGDWVVVKPSDGTEIFMGNAGSSEGASVRMFEDVYIRGRVKDPSAIY